MGFDFFNNFRMKENIMKRFLISLVLLTSCETAVTCRILPSDGTSIHQGASKTECKVKEKKNKNKNRIKDFSRFLNGRLKGDAYYDSQKAVKEAPFQKDFAIDLTDEENK